MRTGKVIGGSPPFEMHQELWRELRRRPTAADQSRNTLSQGQIHAFNEGRVQPPAQSQPEVLPLTMVDNLTSSGELISGSFSPRSTVQAGRFIL
jgi:hypothetical protein